MYLEEPLRLASTDGTDEFYRTLRSRHERFATNVRIFCKDVLKTGKEALMQSRAHYIDFDLGGVVPAFSRPAKSLC